MNKELIIEMAKQSGMHIDILTLGRNVELLEAFAKLVAQYEREECAEVCIAQMQGKSIWVEGAKACSQAIRARGNP